MLYEPNPRSPVPAQTEAIKPNFVVADSETGILSIKNILSPKTTKMDGWINYEALTFIGNQGNFDPTDPNFLNYLHEIGITPETVGRICSNAISDTHQKYYMEWVFEDTIPKHERLIKDRNGIKSLNPESLATLLHSLGAHEGLIEPVASRIPDGKIFTVQSLLLKNNNIVGFVEKSDYISNQKPQYNILLALSPSI